MKNKNYNHTSDNRDDTEETEGLFLPPSFDRGESVITTSIDDDGLDYEPRHIEKYRESSMFNSYERSIKRTVQFQYDKDADDDSLSEYSKLSEPFAASLNILRDTWLTKAEILGCTDDVEKMEDEDSSKRTFWLF